MRSAWFRHFPDNRIDALQDAGMRLPLGHGDQDALLAALPRQFVATLPEPPKDEGARLLDTLHALNRIEKLRDGTVPIETWLSAAISMFGTRAEADVFEKALQDVRAAAAERTRLVRWFPAPLLVSAALVLYLGRVPVAPPARMVTVLITDRTYVDTPADDVSAGSGISLDRVADLLERIAERHPRAVAIAIDLSAAGRSSRSVERLVSAIRRARDEGTRVVLPSASAPALVDAAGGASHAASADLERGPSWLGGPVTGAPIEAVRPLSLELAGVPPPTPATALLLPWLWHAADPVTAIPASIVLRGDHPDLSGQSVVLGGAFEANPDLHGGAYSLLRTPWATATTTSAEAHASLAAFAAGGGARWRLPTAPFGAWAAFVWGLQLRRFHRGAVLAGALLATIALIIAMGTRYTPAASPLALLAAIHYLTRRFGG